MTWGFNVFQYIRSLDERTAWSNWDRDQSGFMSRSGIITGIDGIKHSRQLEATPYVVGRLTDPADPEARGIKNEDWETFGNIGNGFSTDVLFKNEPVNTFLVKANYWFSI